MYPATDLQYTADRNRNTTRDKSGLIPLRGSLALSHSQFTQKIHISPSCRLCKGWSQQPLFVLHPFFKQRSWTDSYRIYSCGKWRCVHLIWTDVSEEPVLTQDLHSATPQKTTFFIFTALKISKLTNSYTQRFGGKSKRNETCRKI
jgi:hypothetical protein